MPVDGPGLLPDELSRLAVEACPFGMVVSDPAGTILMVNAEVERLFGYSRQELIGQSIDLMVPPRFRDRHACDHATDVADPGLGALRAGHELSALRKDGSEVLIEVGFNPLATRAGPMTLGVIVDMTVRQRTELLAAAQTRDLKRLNAELEAFAYEAAHELLEPLRTIASYAGLLAARWRGKLDEKSDKHLQFLVVGAKRMQGLVTDLLAFARAGCHERLPQPTHSAAVACHVVERLRARIEETRAEIIFGALPVVNADETQLEQVLQNLIGNALKFRSARPPRIRLNASPRNGEWLFSVEDNGIGIDQQFAGRIFQMFQRLHERAQYEGSGIGLAMAKRIVERHGGRIWFESQPGSGATFYFTLPDPTLRGSK